MTAERLGRRRQRIELERAYRAAHTPPRTREPSLAPAAPRRARPAGRAAGRGSPRGLPGTSGPKPPWSTDGNTGLRREPIGGSAVWNMAGA